MDDPGPIRVADGRELGVARQEAVHERPVPVPGPGVHDEARGLLEHHHVRVLVPDGQRDLLRARRRFRDRRPQQLDDVARPEALRLAGGPARDPHATVGEQALDLRAAPARQGGDGPVDALAGQSLGDDQRFTRTRGTLGAHASAPGPDPFGSARFTDEPGNSVRSTSRIAPIVMHESATLNVGKFPIRTKSTTAPCRKPGDRTTRSVRLPTAPASTSDERDERDAVLGTPDRPHEDDADRDGEDRE